MTQKLEAETPADKRVQRVEKFLSANTVESTQRDSWVQVVPLYLHFIRWSEENGIMPVSQNLFGRVVRSRHDKVMVNYQNVYEGLAYIQG